MSQCSEIEVFPPYLRLYDHRFQTFKNWTGHQTPESLARAGFFYLQDKDEVQCYCCGIRIHKWEPTDDPIKEHLRWSEHCTYAELVSKWSKAKEAVATITEAMSKAQCQLDVCLMGLCSLTKMLNDWFSVYISMYCFCPINKLTVLTLLFPLYVKPSPMSSVITFSLVNLKIKLKWVILFNSYYKKKMLSGVGFEPTLSNRCMRTRS